MDHRGQSLPPNVVDLSDLLLIRNDDEFLRDAYRRMLRRECDISGFLHYREMLRNNTPRRVILGILARSDEGRRTGLAFVGLQGSWGSSTGILSRLHWKVSSGLQRILSRGRWFYRLAFLRPFELLDHKLDYLAHEVQQRSEQLSAKLDAYVAHLRSGQKEAMSRLVAIESRQAELDASLTAIRQLMEEALVREHQQRSDQLSAKLDTYVSHLLASQQEAANRVAGLERGQSELAVGILDVRRVLATGLKPPLVAASENVLVTTVDEFILAVPAKEWRLAAHLAFRGPLEPGVTKLFRSLIRQGMVVADVGAHFGWYTLQAARLLAGYGKVYSFEPAPQSFALLQQNIQVNGFLETGLVELRNAAMADRSGTAGLWLYPEDSTHNTLFPDEGCSHKIEVRTLTLDEALENETHVDVVKIDAEGAEPLILRGMRRILAANAQIRILMEFAPDNLRRAGYAAEAFADEIRTMGLALARIDDLTGEVLPVTMQELISAYSLMLVLTRLDLAPERN